MYEKSPDLTGTFGQDKSIVIPSWRAQGKTPEFLRPGPNLLPSNVRTFR